MVKSYHNFSIVFSVWVMKIYSNISMLSYIFVCIYLSIFVPCVTTVVGSIILRHYVLSCRTQCSALSSHESKELKIIYPPVIEIEPTTILIIVKLLSHNEQILILSTKLWNYLKHYFLFCFYISISLIFLFSV